MRWTGKDTQGNPIREINPTNNIADGGALVQVETSGIGPLTRKDIWATRDAASPRYGELPTGPATDAPWLCVNPGGTACTGTVGASATIYSQLRFRNSFLLDGTVATPIATKNLAMYDFWDPAQQQIIPDVAYYVGSLQNRPLVAGTDYVIEYTADATSGNLANPRSFTWVGSVGAAGGPSRVNGVRVRMLHDYAGTNNNDGILTAVIPHRVTAEVGTTLQDTARNVADNYDLTTRQQTTVVGPDLALTKAANPTAVASGSSIRFTLTPQVKAPAGSVDALTTSSVTVEDTLPPGLIAVNTTGVDPAWEVTQTGNANDGIKLVFTYIADNGMASTAKTLPPISYEATTDVKAPATGQLINSAVISAAGNTQPIGTRTARATVNVTQANVVVATKVVDGSAIIEPQAKTVDWQVNWYNFQDRSQGRNVFYDVLPYPGDARGSQFRGTLAPNTLSLTGKAATDGSQLLVTTDPSAAVTTDPGAARWVTPGEATLAEVTAVKVIVPDFAVGYSGGLRVGAAVSGLREGDVLANTASRYQGAAGAEAFIGTTPSAVVKVVASSLSGVVWWDANRDGIRQANEPVTPAVKVRIVGAGSTHDVVTDAGGRWIVTGISHGSYTVVVDKSSVNGANLAFTRPDAGPDDLVDSDVNADGAATISVGLDRAVVGLDAGLVDTQVRLSKQVMDAPGGRFIEADDSDQASGRYAWDDTVTWKFMVANTGHTAIDGLVLTDSIRYLINPVEQCRQVASGGLTLPEIAPGGAFEVTCQAKAVTDLTNTATVRLPGSPSQITDDARITVAATPGITVSKTVLETPDAKAFVKQGSAGWGEITTWRIQVTNAGTVPLTDVRLRDTPDSGQFTPLGGNSECDALFGDGGLAVGQLAPGASSEYTCRTRLNESVVNRVTAEGTFTGRLPSLADEALLPEARTQATDTATVTVAPPEPTVQKLVQQGTGSATFIAADSSDTAGVFTAGDRVTWRFVVSSRAGGVPSGALLKDPTLGTPAPGSDQRCAALATETGLRLNQELARGESFTIECSTIETSSRVNSVTLEPGSGLGSLSDEAFIRVLPVTSPTPSPSTSPSPAVPGPAPERGGPTSLPDTGSPFGPTALSAAGALIIGGSGLLILSALRRRRRH